jgi:hypothetical protein
VFRDLDTFKPYRPFGDDDHGRTVGFHVTGEDAEYIAYYTPERESSLGFASHEYLHAVTSRSLGEIPTWVNEGIAEYYSTFQPRRRGASVGAAIQPHVAWLRNHMLPIRELFRMSGLSPDYRGGERRGTIYAQSWALVHELIHGPGDASQRFGDFLTELAAGEDDDAAFERVYGPTAIDSLENVLRKRMTDLAMPMFEWKFSDDFDDVAVTRRALDRVETKTILGELLAHMSEEFAPLASAHLRAAWEADSTRPLPAALLGRVTLAAGGADAATWFAAVQRAPAAESRAPGLAGSALVSRRLNDGWRLSWHSSSADSSMLMARSLLTRALESRPSATEWLIPLGLTYLDDTTGLSEGLGVLLQAQESWPRHPDLAGALAVLNLRSGNPGAALNLYDRIPKSQRRAYWRWSIESLILRDAWDRALNAASHARCAEAESVAARVGRRLEGPERKAEAERLHAHVRDVCAVDRSVVGVPPPSRKQSGNVTAASPPANDLGSRVARAVAAEDYAGAEQMIARERSRSSSPASLERLDDLAADVRNQRRLRVADDLVGLGRVTESCTLYGMILDDRPTAAMKRTVKEKRARHCSGSGP